MRFLLLVAATVVVLFTGLETERSGASASPAARKATGKAFHFKSPSGNIQCRMDAASVNCLLVTNSWRRLKPRPANCDVDWVPTDMAMFLDPKSGRWKVDIGGCRGDVGPLCYRADPCVVLRYGNSVMSRDYASAARGIRCASAINGITCTKIGRTPGLRGFRIARQGYAVF